MNQKIKINLDNTTKIKQFIKVTRSFLPEHSPFGECISTGVGKM